MKNQTIRLIELFAIRGGCQRTTTKSLLIATLTLTMLASSVAHAAPVAPDAGQTIRELQKEPQLTAPKAATPLRIEGRTTPKGFANKDELIALKSVHVSGNSIFASSVLEALLADLIGGERSLAELDAGAARITAYYRKRGYILARAYLPAQEIKDGGVVISVLEGVVDKHHINNQSRLSDERANAYLRGIKTGDVLQAQQVGRALLLLGDTPGVGATRATLQPGSSVGTTDLLVELDPTKPYSANLELDNNGNRYIGEYRLGGALTLNSPLEIGDQLSVRAISSGKDMTYARLAYQLPVGASGLKLGGAYADTRYLLGKEFTALQAHGTATSTSLYVTYPFVRSQATNLSGTLAWESKKLVDQTDVPTSFADKRVHLINLGLAGNRQDALLGGSMTTFDASLVSGKLSMDEGSLALDAATAQSNGAFTRLAYNLNRLQRMTDKATLSLALSGQQASKNLHSSEKFFLGGANGVRAYPQGEGIGDQGWMVNLEVRYSLMEQLQGVAFYDTGSVTINRDPFAAGANTRNIAGVGVGVNAQYGRLQFKTSVAWRSSGGLPQSEPATVNRNPRLWAQLGGRF